MPRLLLTAIEFCSLLQNFTYTSTYQLHDDYEIQFVYVTIFLMIFLTSLYNRIAKYKNEKIQGRKRRLFFNEKNISLRYLYAANA